MGSFARNESAKEVREGRSTCSLHRLITALLVGMLVLNASYNVIKFAKDVGTTAYDKVKELDAAILLDLATTSLKAITSERDVLTLQVSALNSEKDTLSMKLVTLTAE
jgi:hypothetical protein